MVFKYNVPPSMIRDGDVVEVESSKTYSDNVRQISRMKQLKELKSVNKQFLISLGFTLLK